jgi:hypothetical protein
MAMTNAERQARWQAKHRTHVAELQARVAELEAEVARLKAANERLRERARKTVTAE